MRASWQGLSFSNNIKIPKVLVPSGIVHASALRAYGANEAPHRIHEHSGVQAGDTA